MCVWPMLMKGVPRMSREMESYFVYYDIMGKSNLCCDVCCNAVYNLVNSVMLIFPLITNCILINSLHIFDSKLPMPLVTTATF